MAADRRRVCAAMTYGRTINLPLKAGIFKQTGATSVIDEWCQVLYQPFKLSPSAREKTGPDADEPGQISAPRTHFGCNKVAECD